MTTSKRLTSLILVAALAFLVTPACHREDNTATLQFAGIDCARSYQPLSTTPRTSEVYVTFEGIICIVTGTDVDHANTPRGILVRATKPQEGNHYGYLKDPDKIINGDVPFYLGGNQDCSVKPYCKLDGVALSIVNGDHTPLTGPFKTTFDFNSLVPNLTSEANVLSRDLIADANSTGAPPPNSAVLAYFDLTGGEVIDVEPYHCQGKFQGVSTPPARCMNKAVTVRFTASLPTLRLVNGNGTYYSAAYSADRGAHIIVGDVGDRGSHNHVFSKLLRSGVAVPEVTIGKCTELQIDPDAVPGCSNSQWP